MANPALTHSHDILLASMSHRPSVCTRIKLSFCDADKLSELERQGLDILI